MSLRFFSRQVLLDRLGGDLVSEGTNPEFVVAEEVGVVSTGEVGCEFADLGVDRLMNDSGEILDLSLFLG
jgi:hypothetical protein